MTRFPDARSLCPPPSERNIFTLFPFKLASVEQQGLEQGFETYRSMLGLNASSRLVKRKVVALESVARAGSSFEEIYPAGERFDIPPPAVVGASDRRTLRGTARSFFLTCLKNAAVYSSSALLRLGDDLVRDVQLGEDDAVGDYLEQNPDVFHAGGNEAWTIEGTHREIVLEEAFGALVGPHSRHFGHWVWEYLPKFLTSAFGERLSKVPVLVDETIGPTLRSALEALAFRDLEIVELPRFSYARVEKLWYAPALMYAPAFERIGPAYAGPDHLCFPPYRFMPALRAWQAASARAGEGTRFGANLFLARDEARHRALTNRNEVHALAEAYGFSIVYPERYSFAEQLQMIRAAERIVCPEGSAAYLTFAAKPGTKLCILNSPATLEVLTHAYLFEAAGADVTIFTGPAVRANDSPGYPDFGLTNLADYHIDTAALAAFFDEWLNPLPS